MKALFPKILALMLGCAALVAQEKSPDKESKPARDAILFRNGDLLFGRLNSIDRENGIRWDRPDALNAFQFNPGNVSQVDFAETSRTGAAPSTNMCSVHLHNGDQLQGDLASYDGEKLTLDTWFAGRLELPKSAVALIVPLGLPKPVLFSGPTGLEGWTMGKVTAGALLETGEWNYQNEAN